MRRLCYFGVSAANGYRHLVKDEALDRDLVTRLLDDYIATDEVIVYASAKDCSFVPKAGAFELVQKYRRNDPRAAVQVVAADFSGRIVIEAAGVGVGEHRR